MSSFSHPAKIKQRSLSLISPHLIHLRWKVCCLHVTLVSPCPPLDSSLSKLWMWHNNNTIVIILFISHTHRSKSIIWSYGSRVDSDRVGGNLRVWYIIDNLIFLGFSSLISSILSEAPQKKGLWFFFFYPKVCGTSPIDNGRAHQNVVFICGLNW